MEHAPEPEAASVTRPVSLVGAGAIGRAVGEQLAAGSVPGLVLNGFLSRSDEEGLPGRRLDELEQALLPGGIVVEAAGHEAVSEHGVAVLEAGLDLVCISIGALADAALFARLRAAAAASGARILFPSGAVGGLDALRAAAEAGLDTVTIEQRKPAKTLLSADEAAALTGPVTIFDGPVRDIVRTLPASTNVAAAVALAGLGFDRTRSVVVADPALRANRAVLTAHGSFGSLEMQLDNVPSENPKTSTLVAFSIIAALRAHTQPTPYAL